MRTVEGHYREMREAGMGHIAGLLILLGVATIGLLALIRGASNVHRKTADASQTAGHVLHGARWYDLLGRINSFGRDKAIR